MTIVCKSERPPFSFYSIEIELDKASEDADYYYGRPFKFKRFDKDSSSFKQYGILAYPKYSWYLKSGT